MRRFLPFVAITMLLLLGAPAVRAQAVFVGIPGSPCSYSTAVADASGREWFVNDKQYWASGFMDGAYAALGMGINRSSVNFTYARMQNYCAQHPDVTLTEAMLALVAEDRAKTTNNTPPSTSGVPQVVFRQPVFRLDPPTWVLWTYATEWEIVTSDAVDLSSKVPVNLSYFETAADCTAVRGWLAGLPKADTVKGLNISFQCFPSTVDPRSKK